MSAWSCRWNTFLIFEKLKMAGIVLCLLMISVQVCVKREAEDKFLMPIWWHITASFEPLRVLVRRSVRPGRVTNQSEKFFFFLKLSHRNLRPICCPLVCAARPLLWDIGAWPFRWPNRRNQSCTFWCQSVKGVIQGEGSVKFGLFAGLNEIHTGPTRLHSTIARAYDVT